MACAHSKATFSFFVLEEEKAPFLSHLLVTLLTSWFCFFNLNKILKNSFGKRAVVSNWNHQWRISLLSQTLFCLHFKVQK